MPDHLRVLEPAAEAVSAARAAGLRYVTDQMPGYVRKRAGQTFHYFDERGRRIRDADRLGRIRALAIPPAWTDVWICPMANGHIQATGRDARGRKQYRYHAEWRRVRDEDKFGRMIDFARALPTIRARAAADMRLPGLPREKVIATVVRLLDTTFIRVGNEEYARQNGSFGLTTLRRKHVDVEGTTLRFEFKGKSGKRHAREWEDPLVARVLKRCQDLPGQNLFQYVDGDGGRGTVDSDDVNTYLREVTGQPFTAKDFRTWGGTVLAACTLYGVGQFRSQRSAKRFLGGAIDVVAAHLGNTPSVCRKCYVHPGVIESYMSGSLFEQFKPRRPGRPVAATKLRPDEVAVLRLLERLAVAQRGGRSRRRRTA